MKRVTISDIATEAGVGSATVERVLNGRAGVRDQTAEKVIRAATKLGYGNRHVKLHHGSIRVEAILVRPDTTYFAQLNREFQRISETLDRSIVLHRTFVGEFDPITTADHIANPPFRRSALIICAQDDPAITESLMKVHQSGVEVVQIITRCDDGTLTYLGTDNYAAGQTAAYYMSEMLRGQSGTLVAMCHSGIYMNHRERIRGFSDYLHHTGRPEHNFTTVMLGKDDALASASLLDEALDRDPQIIGIYTAGGGDDGVATSLAKQATRRRRVFWIGHVFTEKKRQYFDDGLLDICFEEQPEVYARRSIDLVLKKLNFIQADVSTAPIRFTTITAQNA